MVYRLSIFGLVIIILCIFGMVYAEHPNLTKSVVTISNPEQVISGRYKPLDMSKHPTYGNFDYGLRLSVNPSFHKRATYEFWFNSDSSDLSNTIFVRIMEESDKDFENHHSDSEKRQKLVQKVCDNWHKKNPNAKEEDIHAIVIKASKQALNSIPYRDKLKIDVISGQIIDEIIAVKLRRLEHNVRNLIANYKKSRAGLDGTVFTIDGVFKCQSDYCHYSILFWSPLEGSSQASVVNNFFSIARKLSTGSKYSYNNANAADVISHAAD